MTGITRVKDLFEIPKQIRKGDFVVKLSEGILAPEETARTFVVTPALADAFDRALRLVSSALRDGRSQAAYLHGSFGSGKSHFMALLSLLLQGNEHAWRVAELHALRGKYDNVVGGNLLELHFHMIGQQSIEAAVFSRYLDHCTTTHPDAPIPTLFADEKLFSDASAMVGELGDDRFFAKLNEGLPEDSGWGDIGAANRWDRERFDVAVDSTDPVIRGELFDALARTWFTSFLGGKHSFIDLDSGLGVMSRHAASLGYQGIVLFLDELILWLASRASETSWVHGEAQKMVKLVEAQEAHRDIPIVSFIARQRDLAEMVGEEYAGVENRNLRDSLGHWEGRYDKILLEDRNLPAIVEKRVLKPLDEESASSLSASFEQLQRTAGQAWQTMLGQEDGEAFKKLYPFSPALVDALVALSNSLQRERTAIKLLVEILFEHIEGLQLGEVVPVGDLFDVLAGGEDTADGVMKHRFESAKQIYAYQLLPMIQEANGTNSEEKCPRLRANHPARLGCANCSKKNCRAHNRLAKTLLLAALVPEVSAFKDMNASRLVQLNHGTLKTPIEGTEATLVASTLREWAGRGRIGQLRVGTGNNPTVYIQLEGVDIEPILKQARDIVSPGARQRIVRDMLFKAMRIDEGQSIKEHKIDWRSTSRLGTIKFGNVRLMPSAQLACADDQDWQLIVDYPFDERSFGPNDDLEVVEQVIDEGTGTWSLVWLPSFFSESTNHLLDDLVALEHILETGDSRRRFVSHLAVENQPRALNDLENLRTSKQALLLQSIDQAYGIATPKEGVLDSSRHLEKHLYLLKQGVNFRQRLAATLTDAIESFVFDLLEERYPRHPRFTKKLTTKRIEQLLVSFGEIVDSEDKRIAVDRDRADDMRGTLEVLGLLRVTETAAHLVEDRMLQEIDRRRLKQATEHPSVLEVRQWIDENGVLGLQPEAEDLVVRAYARWAARTYEHGGHPFQPKAGSPIPEDVILVKPELPSHADWNSALEVAAATFGITFAGRALHADNLQKFTSLLDAALSEKSGPCAKLPTALSKWKTLLNVADDADRIVTAASADKLCAGLANQPPVNVVLALTEVDLKTSARAVGQSIANAIHVLTILDDQLAFGTFQSLVSNRSERAGAAEILDQAAEALRQDEIHVALAGRLKYLAVTAQDLLRPRAQTKPGEGLVLDERVEIKHDDNIENALRELSDRIVKGAAKVENAQIEVRVTVRGKEKA